jgi:hypothetical protein
MQTPSNGNRLRENTRDNTITNTAHISSTAQHVTRAPMQIASPCTDGATIHRPRDAPNINI